MDKGEIFCILKNDSDYPSLLRKLPDAPEKLYVRGDVRLLSTKCFSVVGSRGATEYAARAVRHIVEPLAAYFTIVSGMALGADALAHRAALAARGPTIAVLGCGLNNESIYPPRHEPLAHTILDSGGCLVSEYPPGTPAYAHHFPARNRIVAGLSFGVLIIEAAEASGTMITARLALDYGRDVFAIPGSIFAKLSDGTNKLIASGAKLVRSADDVLHEYGIERGAQQALLLSPEEQRLYALLEYGDLSIDELQLKLAIEPQLFLVTLSGLELRGTLIKKDGKFAIAEPKH